MKGPFQPGDRVAFYQSGQRFIGKIASTQSSDGRFQVSYEHSGVECLEWTRPQQLRHLRKKPRREIWVNFWPCATTAHLTEQEAIQRGTERDADVIALRFIEARPKKEKK